MSAERLTARDLAWGIVGSFAAMFFGWFAVGGAPDGYLSTDLVVYALIFAAASVAVLTVVGVPVSLGLDALLWRFASTGAATRAVTVAAHAVAGSVLGAAIPGIFADRSLGNPLFTMVLAGGIGLIGAVSARVVAELVAARRDRREQRARAAVSLAH